MRWRYCTFFLPFPLLLDVSKRARYYNELLMHIGYVIGAPLLSLFR